MTSYDGGEKKTSVRNNLINIKREITDREDIDIAWVVGIRDELTKLISQVSRIHDNLEEAEKAGWKLDDAMDGIADELYYNGVYVDEV